MRECRQKIEHSSRHRQSHLRLEGADETFPFCFSYRRLALRFNFAVGVRSGYQTSNQSSGA
jgi:hypothetical protein